MSRFLKQSSMYSIANLLTMMAGIVSFPILTRMLSVSDYGAVSLLNALLVFAVAFGKFGLQHSSIRFYSDYSGGEFEGRFYATSFWGTVATSFIFSVIFYFLLSVLSGVKGYSFITHNLSIFIAGLVFMQSVRSAFSNFYRAKEKSGMVSIFLVIQKYSSLVFIIGGFLLYRASVEWFFFGLLSAELILFFIMYWLFVRSNGSIKISQFDTSMFKKMAIYGLPMLGFEITSVLHDIADRVILNDLMGKEIVGIYSASYNIAELVKMLIAASLTAAIVPIYLNIWKKDGEAKTLIFLNKVIKFYSILFPVVVFGFVAIGEEVLILLASEKYESGYSIFPYVIVGLMINAAGFVYAAGLFIKKKSLQLFVPVLMSSLLNIALNYVFIPWLGMNGAALATMISFTFLTIIMFFQGQRVLRLTLPWGVILKSIFCGGVMYWVLSFIVVSSLLLSILVKILIGVIAFSVLIFIIDKSTRLLVVEVLNDVKIIKGA